ncbi:unnamed protein product [Strongylus vulgaris]|uniref:Lipin N-terminal domain-containing protein n=1 Tax=Strongylus vulgaris TaxID=40348 RepID=A0A3P7IPN6_STRVU|nr:unnamed protein product [Strongylus vulgaris]
MDCHSIQLNCESINNPLCSRILYIPTYSAGAIDVIVVEQPDGEYKSTPFHVRFGKYGVFSHSDKYVDIQINGEEIDLKMKLGESGVAFFVEEADGHQIPSYMLTSPLPEPGTPQQQTIEEVLTESAKILGEKNTGSEERKKSIVKEPVGPDTPRNTQEGKQEWVELFIDLVLLKYLKT